MSRYPFDSPVSADLWCRNCGDRIVAVAQVFTGSYSIAGLNEYEWTHEHGADECRLTTKAQPFDAWQATTAVEAVVQARRDAADALLDTQGVER